MVRSLLATAGFFGGLMAIIAICYFVPIVALIGFAALMFSVIWLQIHEAMND